MAERTSAPYRADHVGSLLRPQRLLVARQARDEGKLPRERLREIEDDCIREVIKKQEEVGLQSITDGEYRRFIFHVDFLEQIEGLRRKQVAFKTGFHGGDTANDDHTPTIMEVAGKVRHVRTIVADDFRFVKDNTVHAAKVTIPSPSFAYVRGGRALVSSAAYPDLDRFFSDLADVYRAEIAALAAAGCTNLQIDETNFALLCDPAYARIFKERGDDPADLQRIFARLINDSIRDRPSTMSVSIHLCRGNYRSGWAAQGGYDPVADFMFNHVNVDGFFLEYDDERSGDFKPLRFLPKGKTAVLGLVSSKTGTMETPDQLKRRIEEAAEFAPLDQLALSPQCGFASSVHGNTISASDQWKKLQLVVDVAAQVWGTAGEAPRAQASPMEAHQ